MIAFVLFLAIQWTDVATALGRAGTMQPGDVYKVAFPRSDLDVVANGVKIKPALALGSWIAFVPDGDHAMVMGDLVLLESEFNPVFDILEAGGIEPTAVHNHLLGESPRIVYLHFAGHGDAVKLAETLHRALAATKTPVGSPPAATPQPVDLPTADLDAIMKASGKSNGGVYQFSIPRAADVVEHGVILPPAMGTATAINFQPTGNGKAAISGDFVMVAGEVSKVIRALGRGGIQITALHSHMLDEQPRLIFMHFWANADARELAKTVRAALNEMAVK
jgi:hypothetical protein